MKFLLFLFIIFIFIIPTSANINISVVSENNKSIIYYNIDNNTNIGTYTNNQYADISYQNYEIRLKSITQPKFGDMWGFIDGVYSQWVYLVVIIFMISLILAVSKVLR